MALDQFLGALTGGSSNQSAGGQDVLSGLLGGLLGGQTGGQQDGLTQLLGGMLGGQTQNQAVGQTGQLGSMLGMLEGVLGSGAAGQGLGAVSQGNALAGDPMMQMLTPLADALAAKMNIPPQMAVMVVSLVAHQLLASHPASGQNSLLDIGQLQQQVSSGQGVSHDYLHSSGLVGKLMEQTGLDKGTAAQSLKTVFDMLGQK